MISTGCARNFRPPAADLSSGNNNELKFQVCFKCKSKTKILYTKGFIDSYVINEGNFVLVI